MLDRQENRRGFLGRLAIALGAAALVPLLGAPAEARSRFRGGWGGFRRGSGFRGYRGYGWGGYGYRGYYPAPRYYAPRYYYGNPYVRPQPYVVPAPRYYTPYYNAPGYYMPMMKNDAQSLTDALSLLEA